jgi:flagellin-like protein
VRRDDGVSETLGTVLMIAMVVVMAGTVYWFVGRSDDKGHAPTAIGLNPASKTATTRTFTITTTSQPVKWGELALKLSGKAMEYDDSLVLPATYCVIVTGSSCMQANAWDPDRVVTAGQQIVVHDNQIATKTLLIIFPEENSAVLSLPLA